MTGADSQLPETTAFCPWYGSNRTGAPIVGRELKGCAHVSIAFAGSMCEALYIDARSLVINDAHPHLMNMAAVAAHPTLGPQMYRQLRRMIYHPEILSAAQDRCMARERSKVDVLFSHSVDPHLFDPLAWAVDYFICCWMSRHETAGTKSEFDGKQSVRWTASGGDSAKHFWSGVSALPAWRKVLRRANFVTGDAFEFIEGSVKDEAGCGLYADPPFPGPGDSYKHTFGEAGQRRLARAVSRFQKTRVVMRFYRHPLVEELYPESRWRWIVGEGKRQTNEKAPEVLLVRGGVA